MLIGVCGALCAGKKTVAQYLVDHHGFRQLYLQEIPTGALGSDSGPATAAAPPPGVNGVKSLEQNGVNAVPLEREHTFSDPEALLDFVTKRWRDRWVTTTIPSEAVLDLLMRRPFFILISVDAPITVRWKRYQAQHQQRRHQRHPPPEAAGSGGDDDSSPLLSLEAFIAQSDTHLYDPHTGLQPLIARATVKLLNTSASLAHLYATLGKLDLPRADRLRPSWDAYFMALAALAAQRSNCMKRRVGCVLVGPGKRVISTGYNGTPRGLTNCAEGGCGRCNAAAGSGVGLATCLCLHAEENALLEAGRERIRDGAVLYCDTCPCLTCSIKICQVGISEVVYAQGYSMDRETAEVFREAGVRLRQFIPPPNGLIHLEKMELY